MSAPAASHQEVRALIGELDELIIERVVATGATASEIAEAVDGLEDERRFGERTRVPSSPQVTEVRAILLELVDDDDDHELYASSVTAD